MRPGGRNVSDLILRMVVIGVGATALTDIWAQFLRLFGFPKPNWAMPGRWFAHLPRGRIWHDDIAKSEPVAGELAIGWICHYLVGIAFAGIVLAIAGAGWTRNPTFLPALIVGWATIGCGWFILQPGMGAGIAASRTPRPSRARLHSVVNHLVFGIGLYLTAMLVRPLSLP